MTLERHQDLDGESISWCQCSFPSCWDHCNLTVQGRFTIAKLSGPAAELLVRSVRRVEGRRGDAHVQGAAWWQGNSLGSAEVGGAAGGPCRLERIEGAFPCGAMLEGGIEEGEGGGRTVC